MKTINGILIALLLGLLINFSVGFFVIQPIGAVPDGATIMYFRLGLNVSFITSADGILIDNDQDVSLLGRVIVLGKFGETVNDRKIVKLPYSRSFYLISTGGKEFEK